MLLRDYCKQNNIDFFDLTLQCIFCKSYLSLTDCANFQEKVLSVIQRGDKSFAACISCLSLSARLEREKHTQCAVKCSILDCIVGKPLEALLMRCVSCYQVISAYEKQECVALNRDAFLVRGTWRTFCKTCRENHEG